MAASGSGGCASGRCDGEATVSVPLDEAVAVIEKLARARGVLRRGQRVVDLWRVVGGARRSLIIKVAVE